jgi:hypothetical protein
MRTGSPRQGGQVPQKSQLGRRVLIAVILGVFVAAAWTGSAVGAPVFRSVTFEQTYSFDSPFCGDAVIAVHEVGRITFTVFLDKNGFPQSFALHDAAITYTITNTETGASITSFYSNFMIRSADEPPLVSAGRAELTYTLTFDADGNPIFTQTGLSETPNMVHLTQLLCA